MPPAQGPWQPQFHWELGLIFWENTVTTGFWFYPPTPILESFLEDESESEEESEEPDKEPPPESEESEQEIVIAELPERIQINPTEDFPLLRNPLTEATTPDTNTPVPAHTVSLLFQTPLVTTSGSLLRPPSSEKKEESPDSDNEPLGSLPPLLQNLTVPTFTGLPLALLQNQNIVANILHYALPQPPAPPLVPPMAAPAAAGPLTAAELQAGLNKLKGNALIFNGRPNEDPLSFKNRMGMLICTKGLTDDNDKLQEWLNHLGGRAATWANAFYEDLLNPPPAAPGGQGGGRRYTYQNFLNKFNQTYAFENLQNNSRKQLDNLRQGRKSVAQYIQQFQTLAHLVGYRDADTLQHFLTGLDDKIRYDLMLMGHDNTLERAMAQAQQLELIRSGNRDAYQDPGRTSNTQVKPDPYGHAPMDLDATKTPTKPTTQCYRCRKYGHIARNCKAPGNFRGRGRGHGRGGMLYVPPRGFRGRTTHEVVPEEDRMQGVEQELTAQRETLETMSMLITALADKNRVQQEQAKDF